MAYKIANNFAILYVSELIEEEKIEMVNFYDHLARGPFMQMRTS